MKRLIPKYKVEVWSIDGQYRGVGHGSSERVAAQRAIEDVLRVYRISNRSFTFRTTKQR